jgi:DNA-directed RNA polymerase specialized sigma24 family protein
MHDLVTFPDRPAPALSLPEALQALARSQAELAAAVRQQAAITEVLVEAMPAATEAKILGVSACTVRRRRAQRRNARLLQASA